MTMLPKISRRYKKYLAAERARRIKLRAYLRGRRAKAKAAAMIVRIERGLSALRYITSLHDEDGEVYTPLVAKLEAELAHGVVGAAKTRDRIEQDHDIAACSTRRLAFSITISATWTRCEPGRCVAAASLGVSIADCSVLGGWGDRRGAGFCQRNQRRRSATVRRTRTSGTVSLAQPPGHGVLVESG